MRAVRRQSNAWAAIAARNRAAAEAVIERRLGECDRSALTALTTEFGDALGGDIAPEVAVTSAAQHVATRMILKAICGSDAALDNLPASRAVNRFFEALGLSADDLIAADDSAECRRLARPIIEAIEEPEARPWIDTARTALESFMSKADPDEAKNLGLVYTPTEIADCMLRFVDGVSRRHLGVGLTTAGVHVHDPFAGVGVFLSRLISGACDENGMALIDDDDLDRKYGMSGAPELHSNEIVPSVAAAGSAVMAAAVGERGIFKSGLVPLSSVACGDAFLSAHASVLTSAGEADTSERVRVIVSNPPWSAGKQRHTGRSRDHRPAHPEVARRIRETYGRLHRRWTGRPMGRSAGDLYVRAFRWATDFVGASTSGCGIVAYVHPNAMSTASSLAGLRAGLRNDFSHIYVINLRGRAAAEAHKRHEEGARIFGQSSMTGAQITVLVRDPQHSSMGAAELFFAEAPDSLDAAAKIEWLSSVCDLRSDRFAALGGGGEEPHIWLHPSDDRFGEMEAVLPTGHSENSIIKADTLGMATKMDAYVFSLSREALVSKVTFLLSAYQEARSRFHELGMPIDEALRGPLSKRVKWTAELQRVLRNGEHIEFNENRIARALHRPFVIKWLYCDDRLIAEFGEALRFGREPDDEVESILVPGPSDSKAFGVLATDLIADRNVLGYSHAVRVAPRHALRAG